MSTPPLHGVRVIDLTRLLPGNYCTWLLGALGAEIIKVEDPGAGDYMRRFGVQVDGMGATHHVVNRGKSSVVIDLKHADGQAVFLDLVRTADVVVEAFRPGVLERLGIGWEVLRRTRPSLVLASVSSFGASGPLADVAGHDINYLAFSGLLARMGSANGPPSPPAVPLADLVGGGLVPALGVVALVLRARQTGQGGLLEASIAESLALLPSVILSDQLAGVAPPPVGRYEFDGARAWYRCYPLADRGHVSVGAIEERFFATLCGLIGRPDLVAAQHDPGRQDEIAAALSAEFAGLTRAQAAAKYGAADACVLVVNDVGDMVSAEHTTDRGLIRKHPDLPFPVPVAPFVVDGERAAERGPAPRQGQHTVDVLRAAGLPEDQIAALLDARVVAQRE